MRLTVATNFEPDLVEGIKGYPVYELFGKLPADPLGGGRASYMLAPLAKRGLADHVRDAHRHGIRFNYLLNAACLDNREWTRKGQREIRRLLDWLAETKAKAWCLRCHGEPKGAPDPMFPKYTKDGWKDGQLIGAAVARVAPKK